MSHCHHHSSIVDPGVITQLSIQDPQGFMLVITLFLTGLAASFTHCMGMCGPIAISQMSMRLMNLTRDNTTELSRVHCALSVPYYLGKAISYVLLTVVAMTVAQPFRSIPYIKGITFVVLIVTAVFFVQAALNRSFGNISFTTIPPSVYKFLSNSVSLLKLSPYGIKGVIMGMFLGLIPCGVVYLAIVSVITRTDNIMIAVVSIFVFGIATVPGLFIVSYVGEILFKKYNSLFKILYSLVMLFNAYLLFSFAFSLE